MSKNTAALATSDKRLIISVGLNVVASGILFFAWRASRKGRPQITDKIDEILTCPITLDIMSDPVIVIQSKITYDRESLCQWLLQNPTRCPLGEDRKEKVTYVDNISIRQLLTSHLGDNAFKKYDDSDFQCEFAVLWFYEDIAALLYGMNRKKIDWMAAQRIVNNANQEDPIVVGFKALLLHPSVFENRRLAKNEDESLRLWREQEDSLVSESDGGSVWAQWLLGMFYDSVKRNEDEAMAMFTQAADKGHAFSQCSLGALCENRDEHEKAQEFYEYAAERGHALAQYSLAMLHDDFNIMRPLLEQAAAQGHASSLYYLGNLYVNSDVVPRNLAIAREYFESAAEQGHEKARTELLSMHSQAGSELWQASHLRLRAEVTKCETMEDFKERIYRDPDYEKSLRNIEKYQLGGGQNELTGHWAETLLNRERQCEKWAKALKNDEKWASELNDDLRTVRKLLFEVCDRWNQGRLTDEEIISSFNMNILRIILNCLPMDRANSLFQLTDYCFNTGGKHFFAKEHQSLMEETGVIPPTYKGQHTMNRRYLQLVCDPKLGLNHLSPWIEPTLSPLIAISDDVLKKAKENGIVIYKSLCEDSW
jgi:TPR repeat protein